MTCVVDDGDVKRGRRALRTRQWNAAIDIADISLHVDEIEARVLNIFAKRSRRGRDWKLWNG